MRSTSLLLATLTAALVLLGACEFLDPTRHIQIDLDRDLGIDLGLDVEIPGFEVPEGAYIGPDGQIASGARIGEACNGDDEPCRPGLSCESGTCRPAGNAAVGEACVVSGECVSGASCGLPTTCWEEARAATPPRPPASCGFALCVESAGGALGEPCLGPGTCQDGLRCELQGFSGICLPQGDGDIGRPCETHADCADPLMCAPGGPLTGVDGLSCQIPAAVADQLFMPSVTCEPRDPDAPFAFYFEIPGGDAEADFFQLPFPNDIRRTATGVDLSGFHNPGPLHIGGELVQEALALAESMQGFSTSPTVYFRMTQDPSFDSLRSGGDEPTIRFINIDPNSPNYGNDHALQWTSTTGGGPFICPRYVAVRPAWAAPLEHGTTYAVVLSASIRSSQGVAAAIAPDFATLIGGTAPSDTRLARAWNAYAPLRAWAADTGFSLQDLSAAAVFTTHDPDALMPAIRSAARAGVGTLSNITVCGDGVTSPCQGDGTGACVNGSSDFWEIHATYTAPVLQQGVRPYAEPGSGGDLRIQGGNVQSQGDETICVGFSIPKGEIPVDGWPVALFGHGTGGSFTSHLSGGVARALVQAKAADGTNLPIASVGIDGPMHGGRQGDTTLGSDMLFYNIGNPPAAVGNVQQGAADFFALTRLLEAFDEEIPGVGRVHFNPNGFAYVGHSQGSTVGALFVPHEPRVHAAVFSGQGAGFILSLLNKTSPHDIRGAVEYIYSRGGLTRASVSDFDPLMSLMQFIIDPVDPLNYARLLYLEPVDPAQGGTHVLQTFGFGDTYSPEPTQETFARTARLALPKGSPGNLSSLSEVEYPVSGNRTDGLGRITAVVVPLDPGGAYDGHFVMTRNAGLLRQVTGFVADSFVQEIPTVLAP